ncbi:hypothetical protein [Streptomyces puniciscabiei]|uniref:hypothetical protein n=1 Tax=Streptomyces puniciscabiei TaxID=164348 RepID=UPI0033167A54
MNARTFLNTIYTHLIAILSSLYRRFEDARTPVAVWDDPTLRVADERSEHGHRRSLRLHTSTPKRA